MKWLSIMTKVMFQDALTSLDYKSYLIKDINIIVLMTEAECLNCWAKHFQQLLNQPPPQADEDLLNTDSTETNNSSVSFTSLFTATISSLKNG